MERSPTTLFVRHLPHGLDAQEKVDFLCHFGADRVRVMGVNGGAMKHTAFAQFDDPLAAELALQRLHQLEILSHKLVVEYARVSDKTNFPSDKDKRTEIVESETETVKSEERKATKHAPQTADEVLLKHNIPYPKNPTLRYFYPPPTVSTLTNIANALASHSRFYVQVLHLMNKMNLPAPFGGVTPTPPLAQDSAAGRRTDTAMFENSSGPIEEVEMEYCSTEESELESDSESTKLKPVVQQPKRVKRPRKRMKVTPHVYPQYQMQIKPVPIAMPSDVFEQAEAMKSSQIQFNLSVTEIKTDNIAPNITATDSNEGFGKIEPTKQPDTTVETQKPEVNYKIDTKLFITKTKIIESRLSDSQIKEFSVFKGYKAGETTSRLYIKNLHKHTTEQDLVNLFGGYVDWTQELAYHMFDVRLMKEGRMKGQAFVTMSSDAVAASVLKDCNGYVQNGKPMVIQFARSAKAKDNAGKK